MLKIPGALSGPPSTLGAVQDVDTTKLSQSEKLLYDEGVKKGEDNVSNQKWWTLGLGLLVGGFVGANLGTMVGAGVTARKLGKR